MKDTIRYKGNESKRISTYQLTMMGLMTALICVIAPISIPLPGGVPLSLATMVIYLTVYLLGGKKGTLCCMLYILLGIIGLPVFSGYGAGIGKVTGPTGGYIIGYIFMAMICGLFLKLGNQKMRFYIAGMLLGSLVLYGFGTIWFMYVYQINLKTTLSSCVLPFLPGDGIKVACMAIAAPMIRSRLLKASILYS